MSKFFEFEVTGPTRKEISEHSCERKVRYKHKQSARRAVTKMAEKGVGPLEAYRCQFCNGWHVGHTQGLLEKIFIGLYRICNGGK